MNPNIDHDKTVPCKFCREPTRMISTETCDACWRVDRNLDTFIALGDVARQRVRSALARVDLTYERIKAARDEAVEIAWALRLNEIGPADAAERLDENVTGRLDGTHKGPRPIVLTPREIAVLNDVTVSTEAASRVIQALQQRMADAGYTSQGVTKSDDVSVLRSCGCPEDCSTCGHDGPRCRCMRGCHCKTHPWRPSDGR